MDTMVFGRFIAESPAGWLLAHLLGVGLGAVITVAAMSRLPMRAAALVVGPVPPTPIAGGAAALLVRRPFSMSLLLSLCFVFVGLALRSILPILAPSLPESIQLLVIATAFALFVVVLLSVLRWWGVAGFNRRGGIRLAVVPAVLLLAVASQWGLAVESGTVLLTLAVTLLIGFAEEGLFRGVILHALVEYGPIRAAVASSMLFGLAHAANAATGGNAEAVAIQMLFAAGVGFAYALLRLRAGTIWPLILTHALIDFTVFIANGTLNS